MEREVKILIDEEDLLRIKDRIGFTGYEVEENRVFILDNGFLRLRKFKGKFFVTFKGRPIKSNFNLREEIEFSLSEFCDINSFFERLGFSNPIIYSKMRFKSYFQGCVVCLDRIYLDRGNLDFVEIEGSEIEILNLIEFFGLANKEIERRAYHELVR